MDINQLTAELTRQIGYAPSKYQIGILEWVLNGESNGACNAVAGSGKSSSLRIVALALQLLGYKPSEVRVIVFGKENSKDLIAKFGAAWKDSISTLHSCGFRILQQEVGRFQPSERVKAQKYRHIAQDMGYVPSKGRDGQLTRSKAIEKPEDLYKAIDLVRLTLSPGSSEDISLIATHHNIEGIREPAAVAEAVRQILKVGEQQAITHTIDYADQIWLPVKWELHEKSWFKPFRFVLIDECQDLNAAQLELAISLAGSRGRMLFCGDPRQAIMGFAGADNRSYQKIVERTKATELPLSICYRCPRSHIDLVRASFPYIPIEARDNAPDGMITTVTESDLDQHLKVGDMILCRKTAPLVIRCIKLISKGIKATVKGRDIGEQIKRDLEDIGRMPGFIYTSFPDFVRQYKSLKVQRYLGLDNEEQLIEQLKDKLEALTAIYKARVEATSIAQLADYIDSLFSDETSPITLSTCHRAKGLEGDRIFILKPDDLPFTWRNQLAWQKEQEDNLFYVALTRSKSELFVVGTPRWLPKEEEELPEPEQETLPLEPKTRKRLLPDDWGGKTAEFVNILSGRDDYSEDEDAEEDLLSETSARSQLEQEIKEYFKAAGLQEPKLTHSYEGVVKVAPGTMGRGDTDERLETFFSPTYRPAVKRFALRFCALREAELKAQSAEQQAIEAHLEVQREALRMNAEDYEFEGEVQITPDQILVKDRYHNSKTYTYPRSAGIPDWASGLPVLYYPGCKPQQEQVLQSTVNFFSEAAGTNKQLPPFPTKTSEPETALASPEPAETVNDLQSLPIETLETPQKPTLAAEKAITYPFKQWIEPWRIRTDRGTQSRKQIDQRTIDDYAEQMREGLWDWEREPLPIIFDDGDNWYPGDGHHRFMAAVAAEQPRIKIEVRQGSLRDAKFFSCGANRFHGLPRTNTDKRNQVELLLRDEEWQNMSDRAIAEHCGVSAPFVGKIRAELAASGTVNVSTERIDKSGRKIQTANIGTKPKKTQAVDALPHEEQPHQLTEAGSLLDPESDLAEPITQLLPIAQAPDPKASNSADRATLIKAEDVARGGSSPRKPTQAKLRIEGEQSEDIDKLVQRLRQVLNILEESRDYPNRGDAGMRRYLTVRM